MRNFLPSLAGSGFGYDAATARFWVIISMLFSFDQRWVIHPRGISRFPSQRENRLKEDGDNRGT